MPTAVAQKMANLIAVPLPGDNGPYTESQLVAVETRIGRRLDTSHRSMLASVGGNFSFYYGAVDIRGWDLNVAHMLGADKDHPYNIAELLIGFEPQVPNAAYPFAEDHDNNIYIIGQHGAVYYVQLNERLLERVGRPEESGIIVAKSFDLFIDLLQLPDWAREAAAEGVDESDLLDSLKSVRRS